MNKLRKFFDHLHAHEDLTALRKALFLATGLSVSMVVLVGPLSTGVACGILLIISALVNFMGWSVPLLIAYGIGFVMLLSLRAALPGGVYSPEFIASFFAILALSQSLKLKKYWHGEILLVLLLGCNAVTTLLDGSATVSVWIVVVMFFNLGQMLQLHVRDFSLGTLTNSLRSAMRTTAYALPMLFIFILVFQRSYERRLHFSGGNTVMGVSRNLEPGKVSRLTMRSGIVYRVATNRPIPPLVGNYWRVATLIRSSGLSWSGSMRTRGFLRFQEANSKECRVTQKIYGQDYESKNNVIALDRPLEGTMTKDFPPQITSYICGNTKEEEPSESEIKEDLKVDPAPSAAVVELGEKFKKQARSPGELADLIIRYFHDNHFSYTLEPKKFSRDESMDDFLFHSKEGYCEHYAAAMGTLLRVSGVPSRVVVGFEGGTYNWFGGYWLISYQDAHAWTEYWDGARWMRADPTAIFSGSVFGSRKAGQSFLSNIGDLPILESMWLAMDAVFFDIQDFFSGREKLLSLDDFTMDPYLALGSLVFLFILLQIKKIWQPLDVSVREQFQSLCALWAGQGPRRGRNEGYEQYRKRVLAWLAEKPRLTPFTGAINEMFLTYQSFRFGPGTLSDEQKRRFIVEIKKVRKSIRWKIRPQLVIRYN